MSEISDKDLHLQSEVEETDDKQEVETKTESDELDKELDETYDKYLNDMSEYERKSLESELDNKYNKYEVNTEKIKCRNEDLAGTEHPETGVPFEKKQVDVDGKKYEVVVPQFKSEYDAQLPEDKLMASDREQFKECNAQLKTEVANKQELRDKFDSEQLEQIENGDTPDGYTWHHDADVGKMQLVDTETHQKTGHTGGRSIWGGGTENR